MTDDEPAASSRRQQWQASGDTPDAVRHRDLLMYSREVERKRARSPMIAAFR